MFYRFPAVITPVSKILTTTKHNPNKLNKPNKPNKLNELNELNKPNKPNELNTPT